MRRYRFSSDQVDHHDVMITSSYNLKESHSLITSSQLAFLFSVSATGFLPRPTSRFATVSIPMERYEFSMFSAVVSAPDAPTYAFSYAHRSASCPVPQVTLLRGGAVVWPTNQIPQFARRFVSNDASDEPRAARGSNFLQALAPRQLWPHRGPRSLLIRRSLTLTAPVARSLDR